MFVWSYWKTIFTKPSNPTKEVTDPLNQAVWHCVICLLDLCVLLPSSACPRLTRSATRRRRGQSRSRRSCGELPTPCPSTLALELEVCATLVSPTWLELQLSPDHVPRCVTVLQQSATATGAKSSSQTGVITAPPATCKRSCCMHFLLLLLFLYQTTM